VFVLESNLVSAIGEQKMNDGVEGYEDKPPSKEEVNTQTCIRQSCAGRVFTWFGGSLFSWLREVFALQYTSSPESYYRIRNVICLLDFDG